MHHSASGAPRLFRWGCSDVTVLFADLKGSMELLADRDPEEARKLLDPVLEHMMEAVQCTARWGMGFWLEKANAERESR
jgi:class 3 adenylate cyclase